MIIRNSKKAILIGRKIIEDNRVSNECVGFFCRICLRSELKNNDVYHTESDDHLLEELIKFGYAEKVGKEVIINACW